MTMIGTLVNLTVLLLLNERSHYHAMRQWHTNRHTTYDGYTAYKHRYAMLRVLYQFTTGCSIFDSMMMMTDEKRVHRKWVKISKAPPKKATHTHSSKQTDRQTQLQFSTVKPGNDLNYIYNTLKMMFIIKAFCGPDTAACVCVRLYV